MKFSSADHAGPVSESAGDHILRQYVAEIAAAYLSNAKVSAADVPGIIRQIAESLGGLAASPSAAPGPAETPQRPTASQVRNSINEDWLLSFENGQRYKSLKRHLTERGLTPADYRLKWGLPVDYPMVAPSFHAKRSALSKALQLGQKGALSLARRRAEVAGR